LITLVTGNSAARQGYQQYLEPDGGRLDACLQAMLASKVRECATKVIDGVEDAG
jgi:hypothetical protein